MQIPCKSMTTAEMASDDLSDLLLFLPQATRRLHVVRTLSSVTF
jgi:hypothetical protein